MKILNVATIGILTLTMLGSSHTADFGVYTAVTRRVISEGEGAAWHIAIVNHDRVPGMFCVEMGSNGDFEVVCRDFQRLAVNEYYLPIAGTLDFEDERDLLVEIDLCIASTEVSETWTSVPESKQARFRAECSEASTATIHHDQRRIRIDSVKELEQETEIQRRDILTQLSYFAQWERDTGKSAPQLKSLEQQRQAAPATRYTVRSEAWDVRIVPRWDRWKSLIESEPKPYTDCSSDLDEVEKKIGISPLFWSRLLVTTSGCFLGTDQQENAKPYLNRIIENSEDDLVVLVASDLLKRL